MTQSIPESAESAHVILPVREQVFAHRAERLRQLADLNPISGYLRLMASVIDAQHEILQEFIGNPPSAEAMQQARQHAMPVAPVLGMVRDPRWQEVLQRLLDRIEAAGLVNPPLGRLIDGLRLRSDAALDAQADAVLSRRFDDIEPGEAPFLMAALQVVWTDLACDFASADLPALEQAGLCPCCGAMPVASLVHADEAHRGQRYLQCSVCATQWRMARGQCSNCDSSASVTYHGADGGNEALKTESCDACKSYRKIGYQEQDQEIEPFADDLASLALDVAMGEAGYVRPAPHPFLWPELPAGA